MTPGQKVIAARTHRDRCLGNKEKGFAWAYQVIVVKAVKDAHREDVRQWLVKQRIIG